MFISPIMFASALVGAIESAKVEQKRWDLLTPEQRAEELRVREVRALERMANAQQRIADTQSRRWF